MITKRTVLILGAGASIPLGFPSGRELLNDVCSGLLLQTRERLHDYIFSLDFTQDEIDSFRLALLRSGRQSVDQFLEHRPEFLEIGKAAIAATLIPYESNDRLFGTSESTDIWYEYLFNKMTAGKAFEDFERNALSILTYNYDRSIEHYLFTALKHSYGKNDQQCEKALSAIPIIHLHGHLGGALHIEDNSRLYDPEVTPTAIRIASKAIRIIHEYIDEDPQFKRAYKLLSDAMRICFLGFGYDPTNLERLSLVNISADCDLMGTAYGFSATETEVIEKRFSRKIRLEYGALGRIDEFLHHYIPFD